MKAAMLRIAGEISAREVLFFAGVASYFYGRYHEVPTRAFVECGVLFIVLGLGSHIAALIRSLRGGKG